MRADMPDAPGSTHRTASIINFILGIWVLISPFVLRIVYSPAAVWNNVIVGIIIIAFAANRAWGGRYQSTASSWVNFILGIWLIISPWVLNFRIRTPTWNLTWSNVIVGIIVAVVSAVATTNATTRPHERH